MPFHIVHNDITKMNTDAIVNAANSYLKRGGGVCGAIFSEAGSEMLEKECDAIGTCPVGHAVITKGYQLPAKYIIHTVGPIWNGGTKEEGKYLASCYRSSLELARKKRLKSISIPLISSGAYGFPKGDALRIAIDAISEFLMQYDMEVYLVVFDRKSITLSTKLFHDIEHYIDTYYEDSSYIRRTIRDENNNEYFQRRTIKDESNNKDFFQVYKEDEVDSNVMEKPEFLHMAYRQEKFLIPKSESVPRKLEAVLKNLGETFSEMLLRIIDEKGKTDIEVYKKANMDRKLFSKIRSNKDYQPKKSTALALAISLELSLDETKDLLQKAGYSLSTSHKFDVIIKYFIENGNYNIYEINEALFCFEEPLLGA